MHDSVVLRQGKIKCNAMCNAKASDRLLTSMPLAARLSIPLMFMSLAGCGTPGAPQPPSLNLAAPVTDLKAVRTGNQVKLTWTVPVETTDGAKFRHRGETKVCRASNQAHLEKCSPVLTLPSPADQKTASADV